MRGRIRAVSRWLSAGLLLSASAFAGGARGKREEVVLKSLDTVVSNDGRPQRSRGEFLRYRVEKVEGDSVFLVADQGTRGWVNRQEVVPIEQAVAYFSAAIKQAPRSAEAYRMRGLAYYELDEYRRATRDAVEASRLDPTLAAAFVDCCQAKLARKDYKGALADADEALRLDPKSPRAYRRRARVYQAEKMTEKALDDWNEAIRLDPTDGVNHVYRAFLWSNAENVDRAIADCTEAIRLEPSLTWGYLYRGLYRTNSGEARAALADFDEALRLDPHQAGIYLMRSTAWFKLEDRERALADCDEALRIDPSLSAAHTIRGMILVSKGQVVPGLGEWVGDWVRHPLSPVKVTLRFK